MAAVTNAIVVVIIAMIAMYFKFVIRKILLVFGFPKLETIHPELGEYDVGALKIRLSKELTPCQFFYPVEKDAKRASKKFVGYYRPAAVKGLIKFMETGESADGVLQFLQDAKHPNLKYYGATPMSTSRNRNNGTKFPLVVFSHGLSGTIEGYTQLCSQLASLGCVVVAPEHADSSASYSSKVLEDGSIQEIWYQAPTPDSVEPYSREKMIRFRGPHAEIRVDELTALYGFLQSGAKVSYENNSEEDVRIANAVLESFDPMNLHLVGHSFGSSTQLLAAQRWATQRLSNTTTTTTASTSTSTSLLPPQPIVPLTITVCDTWNFALSDEILSKGIPKTKDVSPPILSVISNEWVPNPEVEPLKEFLRQSQPHCGVTSYYAKHSMHQSFSDTEAWLPTSLAVSFENRGQGEERHVTIRAVVSAFSKHTGIGSEKEGSVIEALVEYPIDK